MHSLPAPGSCLPAHITQAAQRVAVRFGADVAAHKLFAPCRGRPVLHLVRWNSPGRGAGRTLLQNIPSVGPHKSGQHVPVQEAHDFHALSHQPAATYFAKGAAGGEGTELCHASPTCHTSRTHVRTHTNTHRPHTQPAGVSPMKAKSVDTSRTSPTRARSPSAASI